MTKPMFLLILIYVFGNSSSAKELVFERLHVKVDAPHQCEFETEKKNNIEAHKGTCSSPNVILLYQQGAYGFLSSAIQKVKDNPPKTLRNLAVGDLLTNSFADGSESKMISFRGEDKAGRSLNNVMFLLSSADKQHGVMVSLFGGKSEDNKALNQLFQQAVLFQKTK